MQLPLVVAAATLVLLSTSALAQPKRVAPFETPFFVAMQTGDPDVTVATHGPLSLVVRCLDIAGEVGLRLLFASSVDGWHLAAAGADGQRNLLFLPAGEQLIVGQSANGEAGVPGIHGTSAVAPDGDVLTLASDTAVPSRATTA
jgi:hypothetical protein